MGDPLATKDATMDFQSLNLLNVRFNLISGNLFPMTSDGDRFPIFWKIYSGLVWLIELIRAGGFVVGIMRVPRAKALVDGTIIIVVSMEVLVTLLRIQTHGELVRSYIRKLNDMLRIEDETMRRAVTETLEPMRLPLHFYWVTGLSSLLLWLIIPFALIFQKSIFYYVDYRLPLAISKQPFSTGIFVLGGLLISIGSVYMFFKKAALDIYMVYLVLLMTTQYRYIAAKLAVIFRENSSRDERDERDVPYEFGPRTDLWTEKELKELCRHHNAIIHLSFLLKKLLSLNFSLIYIINVLRFCFLGLMLITALSGGATLFEKLSIAIFGCSGIVQFYILCSCVQQVLDSSTKITDIAFHERWYHFGPSIQRMFVLMILGNHLECKLAVVENFNLSLSSFMSALNQAYSFALLFLRMK